MQLDVEISMQREFENRIIAGLIHKANVNL